MRPTLQTPIAVSLLVAACCAAVVNRAGAESVDPFVPGVTATRVDDFNRDWKFTKGDPSGAEDAQFDDSGWQSVRVPHDWAIAGPFEPRTHGYAGKLPWKGVGWYRKTFQLEPSPAGRGQGEGQAGHNERLYLDFDGVMAFPTVYVNGQLAGQWDYGYTPFRVDITPYVKYDEPNTVAVRVDTRKQGTRWYPGAGIYRGVKLATSNPVHVAHWGTFVTTPEVSDERAKIVVRTTIENHTDAEVTADVAVELVGGDSESSQSAAYETTTQTVPAGGSADVEVPLEVAQPHRWDVDDPHLYMAQVVVRVDGQIVDVDQTSFGIRTFEFTADDGFHLNGRRVQLYGVNLHHDHGPLGAAFYTRAMERQLEIMREMGVNAIRTSHNPPAAELLDLCDRMGFVVWDECFDKWDDKAGRWKGQPPLKEFGERHIRNLIMRDRNHPSVVAWSIGNEIPGGEEGVTPERVAFMAEFVRKYDPTRPVGLACHIPEQAYTTMFDALDFTGWNYQRRYGIYRDRNPDKPIIYSESASALSTRGFYELPLPTAKAEFSDQHQVNSYDLNSARWSDIADEEFDLMERDDFVAGEFVWTGFDYLGEPTPFDQEARSSYFGIVDLVGIPKDRYWLYRSHWRPDVTTIHILPHWNWSDRVGQNVPVFVYTNGDSAELFLNGRSLGRREKTRDYRPPVDVAQGKSVSASSTSSAEQRAAALGNDGNSSTGWRAADEDANAWWQVDLGQVQPVCDVVVTLDDNVRNYQYNIKTSQDGNEWQTVVDLDRWREEWGHNVYHNVDQDSRYLRFEFTKRRGDARAGIREFLVYPQSYYAVCDKYRLRWMDVAYEPGELKVVAYKHGKPIGEATMRTAGQPAALRMTPDRSQLDATGDDLCYVLVEAVDAEGTLCPLADNRVRFLIDGPAEIAGVGNGNPMSFEPFQSDQGKLFYGKAMLILRTTEGQGGDVRITAESNSLQPATVTVRSQPIPAAAPAEL
jgi:beta-galactosidase